MIHDHHTIAQRLARATKRWPLLAALAGASVLGPTVASMTRTIVFRRIVGFVTVALALGAIAGPASARTFDANTNGSPVYGPAPSTPRAAAPAFGVSSIERSDVAIG
jgi:hypothetical protein